jgi:membrane-associated protein
MPIDLEALIQTVGLLGLFAIVFAETGLFVGFLLPGDSLLITAGLVAQRGQLDLPMLMVVLVVAAIAGDATGYWIGRRAGARLFQREDSRFFKRRHLQRAEAFYARHGGKTIVLARFMPFVRTFAPSVAGAAGMPYPRFALYNVVGGVAWVVSMTLLGYLLGEAAPDIDLLLLPILGVIVLISVAPPALHLWRERRAEARSIKANRTS